MRTIILATATVLAGLLFATVGFLMTFQPARFVKFNDFLNPGERWDKEAEWRKKADTPEARFAGIGFLLGGLFIAYIAFTRLLE